MDTDTMTENLNEEPTEVMNQADTDSENNHTDVIWSEDLIVSIWGGATLLYLSRRLGGPWSRGRAYPTGKPSHPPLLRIAYVLVAQLNQIQIKLHRKDALV
jgi:hypothetical protein